MIIEALLIWFAKVVTAVLIIIALCLLAGALITFLGGLDEHRTRKRKRRVARAKSVPSSANVPDIDNDKSRAVR